MKNQATQTRTAPRYTIRKADNDTQIEVYLLKKKAWEALCVFRNKANRNQFFTDLLKNELFTDEEII